MTQKEKALIWTVAVVALECLVTELIGVCRHNEWDETENKDILETKRVITAIRNMVPIETSHVWILQRLIWARQIGHISLEDWEAVIQVKEKEKSQ